MGEFPSPIYLESEGCGALAVRVVGHLHLDLCLRVEEGAGFGRGVLEFCFAGAEDRNVIEAPFGGGVLPCVQNVDFGKGSFRPDLVLASLFRL